MSLLPLLFGNCSSQCPPLCFAMLLETAMSPQRHQDTFLPWYHEIDLIVTSLLAIQFSLYIYWDAKVWTSRTCCRHCKLNCGGSHLQENEMERSFWISCGSVTELNISFQITWINTLFKFINMITFMSIENLTTKWDWVIYTWAWWLHLVLNKVADFTSDCSCLHRVYQITALL